MCQLLGMNSLKPARLNFSLAGFLRRGGDTDEHADGWGAAFFEETGCRLLVEEHPSARSPLAQSIQNQPASVCNAIVHIRKATRGAVALRNCHPFLRTLWGREWAFAHNGTLQSVECSNGPETGRFMAKGETDSERAFCELMNVLAETFGDTAPSLDEQIACLDEASARLASKGTFNFMLSDGHTLFARRSTELHYIQRVYPFGCANLLDCTLGIDFSRHNHLDDRMVIIATRPLTDEQWQPLPMHEVVAFRNGHLHAREAEAQFAV